jgi:hypothetical protein
MPMTYTSLIASIQQYTNRTDAVFTAAIPNLIDQAINTIYSQAKSIGFETVFVNNNFFTINQPFINKPANWKETINMQLTIPGAPSTTLFLLPRTYEFCVNYWPNVTNVGVPKFYANYGNNENIDSFYIAPTPNATYPGQLLYLGLPAFNAQNGTNFLTLRYPNLVLYRSILEAVIWLKDDERIAKFQGLYDEQLQTINKDTTNRYTDRTSQRDKD